MITGQVGVVTKHPGWYGRIIRLVTASPAFHVVTAISETEVISAEHVVLTRPIDYFTDILWTQEPMIDRQRQQTITFLRQQLGKPYAYIDIVFILIAIITRRHTPAWITDHLMNTHQWFCSELADAGLIVAGINLFPGRPPCAVTPADFYQHITETANNPEGNLVTE